MAVLNNTGIRAGASAAAAAGDDAYQIEKSLRFNDGDSPRLTRTPSSAGDTTCWTFSAWVKLASFSSYDAVLSAGSSPTWDLAINSGVIQFGGDATYRATNRKLRDPSAWYHIVWAYDSDRVNADSRMRIFVNGQEETSFATNATISSGMTTDINANAVEQNFGRTNNGNYFDGLISNVHFIDGLQLSPAAFGEYNSTGLWVPKEFALPTPNDGTTWSGKISGTEDGSWPKTKAFDGTADTTNSLCIPPSGGTLHFDPDSDITVTQALRIYGLCNGSAASLWINGVNVTLEFINQVGNDAYGWAVFNALDIGSKIDTTNGIKFKHSGAGTNHAEIAAIEVDGVVLRDGQTDQTYTQWAAATSYNINSVHLKFDDISSNAALGTDSLLSNDLTVTNLTAGDGIVTVGNADVKPIYATTGDQGGEKDGSNYNSDSNSSNLELALPGDVLTDEHDEINGTSGTPRTVANTSTVVSTDQSRFYGSSLKFSGSSTTSLEVGANAGLGFDGAFTIEMWYYIDSDQGFNVPICSKNYYTTGSNGNWYIACHSGGSNNIQFYSYDGQSTGQYLYSSGNISLKTWHHIAVTRDGSNKTTIWVDGVDRGNNTTITRNLSDGASNGLMIGGLRNNGSWQANARHGGFIQDLRVYKGVAKYTSSFTPPTFGTSHEQDSLVDTPTNYEDDGGGIHGNFCVLNPLDNGGITLSQGNLAWTDQSASGWDSCKGTMFVSTGKWYWEMTMGTWNGSGAPFLIGVADSQMAVAGVELGQNNNSWCFLPTGQKRHGGDSPSTTSHGSTTFATGNVIQIALDLSGGLGSGKMWVGINGTWQASGNPATGANAAWTDIGDTGAVAPTVANAGGNTSGAYHMNFGERSFKYIVPSGFKTLCTQNLDDTFSGDAKNNPSKYFDIKTYIGNDGTNSVKGVGFQPDLLWIKNRDAAVNHWVIDAVRGKTKIQNTNSHLPESTDADAITSFNSDGFTLGDSSSGSNGSDVKYVSWLWDAGTSSWSSSDNDVTAGTTASIGWTNKIAGFSIVQYEGNDSNTTVGHNLSEAPKFIIIKNIDHTGRSWVVGHDSMGWDTHLWLNGTDHTGATYDSYRFNSTAPDADVFSVGATSYSNAADDTHIAYCWHPIDGYSKFGGYVGRGAANFIYTGFRPRWLMIKRSVANSSPDTSTTSTSWGIWDTATKTYNGLTGKALWANSDVAQGYRGDNSSTSSLDDMEVDILSNGFYLDDVGSENNANTGDYIYAAFAAHPFKTTRAF